MGEENVKFVLGRLVLKWKELVHVHESFKKTAELGVKLGSQGLKFFLQLT